MGGAMGTPSVNTVNNQGVAGNVMGAQPGMMGAQMTMTPPNMMGGQPTMMTAQGMMGMQPQPVSGYHSNMLEFSIQTASLVAFHKQFK